MIVTEMAMAITLYPRIKVMNVQTHLEHQHKIGSAVSILMVTAGLMQEMYSRLNPLNGPIVIVMDMVTIISMT